MRRLILKDRKGQKTIDYIIVVALIAVAVLGAISIFGENIRELFSTSGGVKTAEASLKSTNNPVDDNSTKP